MNDETKNSTDEKKPRNKANANSRKSKSSGGSKEEPSRANVPVAADETSESKDASREQEPSAQVEPSAKEEPSAQKEPSAKEEPSAQIEPSAQKQPPAEEMQSSMKQRPQPRASKSKSGGRFIWVLVVLLVGLLGISGGLGYFTYTGWSKAQQRDVALRETLSGVDETINGLEAQNQRLQNTLNTQKQASSKSQRTLESRIAVAEKRIIAQNRRLQSMSSTSRDDWLLAEAEYLLKLANQRVLIERAADSAVGLLSEADAILRDMVDPDLFPLRKAISQDLAALRLSESIDVEGIYLALLALAQQIDSLPTRPKPSFSSAEASEESPSLLELSEVEKPWWSVPEASFKRFVAAFRDQIKVTPHGEGGRPVVLMKPETHLYVQQNLRMQIERAQLAMLREQQKIYSESLSQAAYWIRTYFPKSEQSQVFVSELQKLEAEIVVKQLPDISGSWELLNTYIQDLHELKGAKAPPAVVEKKNGETPTPPAAAAAEKQEQGGEQ